jgi:hypothetical protein
LVTYVAKDAFELVYGAGFPLKDSCIMIMKCVLVLPSHPSVDASQGPTRPSAGLVRTN